MEESGGAVSGLNRGSEVCAGKEGRTWESEPLESLIIVAGLGGVAEGLADVTVGPLVRRVAVIRRVGHRVGALGLGGAVFGVVEVEAVADVAEEAGRGLLLLLGDAHKTGKKNSVNNNIYSFFLAGGGGFWKQRGAPHPSVSSLPLNSARASFFSLTFSSSFLRCRSTMTLFRKLIWGGGAGRG